MEMIVFLPTWPGAGVAADHPAAEPSSMTLGCNVARLEVEPTAVEAYAAYLHTCRRRQRLTHTLQVSPVRRKERSSVEPPVAKRLHRWRSRDLQRRDTPNVTIS
jgi:hypothetical protein